jgi:HSP20 family protein
MELEDSMAETKTQTASSQGERSVTRRGEYFPSRDLFSFGPFSMIRRLTEEMDRAFSSTWGLTRGFGDWGAWSPPVEVCQRDGDLEISAELPGLSKDDVKVECTEEGITIEGEKKREVEKEEGGIHRSERNYGHFYRKIPLPEGAEADKAKAQFKDGVLQVRVPISEQARGKHRQIPISA